jgi:UDP-N-acetylmuramoyl-L-alanyl-D-glutamate--2,6-diaminopimelate ligase
MKNCNYNISGVSCDSRNVQPGDAFVAIKGFKDDGNKYISNAIEQGASVIYTEEEVSGIDVPVIKVDNARKILANLANEFYGSPSQKLNMVGVTGTNGKTTTTHLIDSLFTYNDLETGLIGTVKVKIGDEDEVKEAKLTTPGAIEINNYLKKMIDKDVKIAAMEVSSHGIKLHRIEGLNFDIVIHTNITRDHLDLHDDFDDYLLTKKRLFQQCDNETVALINIDDQYAAELTKGISAKIITYGFAKEADIKAINLKHSTAGSNFKVIVQKGLEGIGDNKIFPQNFDINLNLLGKHNVYNGLAAVITGLLYGLNSKEIQKGLNNFKPFFRRLEVIYNDKFTIIDDCAHNPGNYRAVLETIKELNYNNLYIINAIRGNRGLTVNQENAEVIAEYIPQLGVNELYITNCEKLANEHDIVSDEEREIFISTLQNNNLNLRYYNRLKPCLLEIMNKIDENDLLVLLGAHPMDTASKITLDMINDFY